MTRRAAGFAAFLAFACLAFLLSCRSGENNGRTLVVSVESFPTSLDPRYGTDLASERLFALVHRGLFATGAGMEAEGDIVERAAAMSPTSFELVLKEGLRFSDGRPLRSSDVVFTLRSVLSGSPVSPKRGELSVLKNIKITGPLSLVLEVERPFPALFTLLNFGIVPEGTVFDPSSVPPGLGPYRIESMRRGAEMVLGENPYSREKPATSSVVLKVIEDPTLRSLELLRGSVDMVVNDIPYDSVEGLRDRGFTVTRSGGANYSYIGINCRRGPLSRTRVRRALAMAIDRSSILENIVRGLGREATGLLAPENWAYCRADNPAYDPAAAAKVMDEEGFGRDAEGVRMRLSYKTSMNKVSRFTAEAIAADLRKIGVILEIRTLEWGSFYGDVRNGNFDLFSLNWIGIRDPDAYRLRFHSGMTPPGGFNRGGYCNGELDALLEAGASETDREKRKAIYARVQRIVGEECPYINLWWPDIVVVSHPRLEPFEVPSDGNFEFIRNVRIKDNLPRGRTAR